METKEKKVMTFKEKLLAVQEEIKPVVKDSVNPHFKSRYADINTLLSEVKPILSKYRLVLHQGLEVQEGVQILITCINDVDSDARVISEAIIPSGIVDPQKVFAYSTYMRRMTLQSLLSLEAEDDDGNTASHSAPTEFKQPKTPYVPSDKKPAFKEDVFDSEVHEIVPMGFVENFKAQIDDFHARGGGWIKGTGWFLPKGRTEDDSMPF
jgi:hypothetical protein